jgi:hypothetical protein
LIVPPEHVEPFVASAVVNRVFVGVNAHQDRREHGPSQARNKGLLSLGHDCVQPLFDRFRFIEQYAETFTKAIHFLVNLGLAVNAAPVLVVLEKKKVPEAVPRYSVKILGFEIFAVIFHGGLFSLHLGGYGCEPPRQDSAGFFHRHLGHRFLSEKAHSWELKGIAPRRVHWQCALRNYDQS